MQIPAVRAAGILFARCFIARCKSIAIPHGEERFVAKFYAGYACYGAVSNHEVADVVPCPGRGAA
jgi:hypothetical protein